METNILVLLALAATAIAGPITVPESDKCSETCEQNDKLNYAPGTTYTYNYRVDATSSIAGSYEDSAQLTIQTTADIEVLSPCEFALRLRGTRLLHSDSTGQLKTADKERDFRRAVQASELRFAFQNGVVKSVCCGEQPEDAWVINFKKGVLSSFQNSMDDLTVAQNVTETDVSGECRTEYDVVSNGYYSTSIKKVKDILSCAGRHSYKTMMQMTPYNVPSELQNAPIMKTTHECEQDIQKGGVLKSSVCRENHVYRPFSNGKSGASTTVVQSLTFSTSSSGVKTRAGTIVSKDSLAFDHAEESKKTRVEVENYLLQICETTRYDIRPESPRLFSELAAAMRSLSESDLEDLHKLLKTNALCQDNKKTLKFFLDALSLTSTDASVKLMTSLIASGEVKGVLAQAWIVSLGFVQAPTSEMLLNAKALLDDEKTAEDAMLPVSSMVNNYCRKMATCDQDYAVLSIIASLERNIGYSCDASGKDFQKVLLSLRAIGNAGHASRAVGPITKCLSSDSNPLEIRVAAAQAFRRMPCEAKNEELWSTYENGDLDSELRLAAYLSLMRCPTDATLNKMAASLLSEEDDQVGAFIYSHLSNLKSTSDPHRQDVARAAANLALEKEFDTSPLKFSRNFEASALINKLNTGFGAEGNVIWSSKTNMPRSIAGNLTIDLFGQAINVLDFGGRLEGLEYLVKTLFGRTEGEKTTADNVEGSLYGRVFGNEMLFMHSKTVKSPFGKLPSTWLDLVIALSKKRDYTLTQSAQFMDLSLKIPTIAGLPLNLNINGTGTIDLVLNGQMDFRHLGASPRSLNIDGEIRPSAAVEVTGSLVLDAMVTKVGLRQRNTLHTNTALKGRVQLERGQLLNVELDTPEEKQEIFSAGNKFFILHDGIEHEQKMLTDNRKEFKTCRESAILGMELCGELSFPNASMVANSPYYPFTGPTTASVTLYKKDTHNSYKILAKRVENKKTSIAQISMNTPGSKVDRAILMEVTLNYPKKTLDATMRTPWKKASIRGVTINNDKMKSLSGNVIIDDVDTYSFTGEVKVDNSKTKIQLSPMVEIRRVGHNDIQLNGYVAVMKPFKAADVDLSLSGIGKMPYTIKTQLSNTKKGKTMLASLSTDDENKYTMEASHQLSVMGKKAIIATLKNMLKINTPTKQLISLEGSADYREDKSLKLDGTLALYPILKKPANLKIALAKSAKKRGARYSIDGLLKSASVSGKLNSFTMIKDAGLVSTKSVLGYTIPKVAKNKITLGGKFNDRSTKAYKKYTLKSNLNVAKNPEYNMGLSMDIDHKKKHSEAEIELQYGKNPKDKTKRLLFSTSLNRKLATWKNAILALKMNALAPAHNIDVSLDGKHSHSSTMLDSNVVLNYGKGKDVKAEVTLRDKSTKLGKYNGKAVVAWPGKEYTVTSAMDQKSDNQYAHTLNLKSNAGTKHSIATLYKMPGQTSHDFSTTLDLAGLKPITLSGSTNLDLKNFALSGEVKKGKDSYGFNTNSKISKGPSAKVALDVYYPARRMTFVVDGGKQKNNYDGRLEAAWDADKDQTKKIVMEGSGYMKSSTSSMSVGGDLSFKSPFEKYEDLMTAFKYGSDSSQHDLSGTVSWGGKQNTIASSITVKQPISLKNLQVTADLKSPFKGLRVVSIEIDHTINPALKTVLTGRLEKETGTLTIEGDYKGDLYNPNLKGAVTLKSTLKNAKNVKLSLAHQHGSGRVASNAALNVNGKPYSYDLDASHSQTGWNIKNAGKLLIIVPSTKYQTSWSHKNSENDMKSTLSSSWGENNLLVNVDASQDLINSGTMSGQLTIDSPWNALKMIDLSMSHKHGVEMLMNQVALKQNGKVLASSNVKFAGRPSDMNLEIEMASPWKPLKNINFVLSHKHAVEMLINKVVLKQNGKVLASSNVKFAGLPSDMNLEIEIASPWKQLKNIDLVLSHKHAVEMLMNKIALKQNGKVFAASNVHFTGSPSDMNLKVEIASPLKQLENIDFTLSHKHGVEMLMNKAALKQNGNILASSNVKFTGRPSDMKLEAQLDSPWLKNIDLILSHKHGYGMLMNKATLKQNGKIQASSSIQYDGRPSEIILEVALTSPFSENINGKLNTKYARHPMTVLAELSWAPTKKVNVEGSVNVVAWNDADVNIKVTTPSRQYRNIVLKASNKDEKGETVSHMNLDYGVRKMIDVESRVMYNKAKKMLRLKLLTPFEQLKSLETGILATGDLAKFDGSADFELVPVLGKYEGNINWQYDDNMKGSLRVNTPLKDYPYIELSTASNLKENGRQSSLTAEYYPRQVYSLDTTYSMDMPLSLEATIRSPYPEYDNLGFAFQHGQYGPKVISHGEVQYHPDKKIEADLNMDWSSNYEGSLIVKTPFTGYETNKVILRHEGDMKAFDSHGEIYVSKKSITADASFKGGWATKGAFTFTSPIPGMKTLKISFNKRGNRKAMKGGAIFILNGDKSQANFNHKMTGKTLKSAFSLKTPKTENFKIGMDHNGPLETFTNKMSINYGRLYDIDTIMAFDHRQTDFSGNGMIKARIDGKRKVARVTFGKTGLIEDMSFSGTASYNRDDVSVNGSWKVTDGVEGEVHITTPFKQFRNVGGTISQKGNNLYNFDLGSTVNYMDGKTINGKMAVSSDGLKRIRINSELKTPFTNLESSSLSVEHDYDMYNLAMSGSAKLTTAVGQFGHGSVSYTKSGNLDNFSVQLDGKHGRNEAIAAVTKRGSLDNLVVSTTASLNGKAINMDGSFKTLNGIDGVMSVKTPFDDYRNLGLKLTHRGELTDFNSHVSIDYMDNKNINGQVEFHSNGLKMITLVAGLTTPSELLGSSKVTFSNNYDSYRATLSTDGEMSTDISNLGNAAFRLSKSGNMYDLNLEAEATKNGKEQFNGKLTNTLQSNSLNTLVSLKSALTEPLELTIDHSGELLNSNTKVSGILGSYNAMSLEATMSNRGDEFESQGQMMFRTSKYGSHSGSFVMTKEGQLNDFKVSATGDLNNNKVSVTGALKTNDEITGSLNVKTPIEGYTDIGMSLTHSGNLERFNTKGDVTLSDGNQFSAKIDFYKYMLSRIETTVEVKTPIPGYEFTKYEWRHEGQQGLFKCYQTLEYGAGKKYTYDMKAIMTPNPTLTLTLKTPITNYEEMMAYGSFVNNWPVASISGKLNAGNGQTFSVDGTLDVTNDMSGSMTVTTPVRDFTNLGISFQHAGNLKSFNSEGRVTYMDNKDISGKLTVKNSGMRIIAELNTPFQDYESNRFEFKKVDRRQGYSGDSSLVLGNKMYRSTIKMLLGKKPEMLITLRTPIEGYETLSASYNVDITGPKYSLDSNVNAGKGNVISLNGVFDMSEDISGFATLKTPFNGYRNLGINIKHTGNANQFQCDGRITYADSKDIVGSVNFSRYMWRHVTASATMNTPFTGMENTEIDIAFEDRQDTITATSSFIYGDDQKLEGSVKMTYSPNYDLRITASSPFTEMRNVVITATADLNAPTYVLTSGVTHNFNKVCSLNGKLNLLSAKKLDGFLEVKTPIQGLEYTKVVYEHKIDSLTIDGSASLAYENGRKVYSAELESTISPSVDATITVKTPVRGYSTIQGHVAYDSSSNRFETSSSLKLEGRSQYTMSSGLDYSVEPMRAHVKISTPHSNIRDLELVLTHEGHLYNFKSTGFLASPLTDNVNAEASLEYQGPFDMSASASMKSTLSGMDDLKVELKTSEISGGKKINAMAGWTDGQQITADVSHHVTEGWYGSAYTTDLSLTTPFIALRSLSLQNEMSKKETSRESKMTLEINGVPTLDYSAEYTTQPRTEGKIDFKQPWPMTYTAGYTKTDGAFEGDLYLNWNRNDMNSNVRLTTNMNDKSDEYVTDRSVDVTVECPQKKWGLTHTLKNTGTSVTSAGELYWDTSDEDKISYDVKMGQTSRRNKEISDATLRLGLPARTLELTGSLSESRAAKTADATFSWDVERDTNKQVGLKATVTKGKTMRGDVTLSMPSLRKEIRVDGELILENGRVILDSKTDISYSTDSRKTITLTSKVQDIADYNAKYNYSVELGLRHPYTNIDMKMNSHLGSSDERLTMGLETSYLTARKQNKNLALLAEINKLKKQLNLQMVSPMTKVEVVGDVLSINPSKLRLINRINDEEVFTSDMTLDTDKKFAQINAMRGNEKLSLSAKYPKNTAFEAYMTHTTPEKSQREALFALSLNTSRLLHSRMAWRPQMWKEFTTSAEETMAGLAYDVSQNWAIINNDIADEVAGKYEAIATHLKEELTPIIDALEKELRTVANRMNQISRELRTIYDKNDFYVQNMAEQYMALQQKYESLVTYYRRTYNEVITSWRQCLTDMVEFPVRQEYTELVRNTMSRIGVQIYDLVSTLEDYTDKVEQSLLEYKQRTQKYAQSVAESVRNASSNMNWNYLKNIDISPYVTSFEMPEEYSNKIDSVRSTAMSGIQYVWERPEIDMLRGNLNSIYQEGSWAYKYWDVEKNLKTNLENIYKLTIEIVEDEVKEITTQIRSLYKIKNPITVWAPQRGEIQADIPLPIEVKRLDEVPDFSPITKKAEKAVAQITAYLPDQSTWESIKETVSKMLPAREEVDEDSPEVLLKKYNSTKKMRTNKKGSKKMKKMRKMRKIRM